MILLSKQFESVFSSLVGKFPDIVYHIYRAMKSSFEIQGQELMFLCPEGAQKLTIVGTYKKGLKDVTVKFPYPNIKSIKLRSIVPLVDVTNQAIRPLPRGGFELVGGKLVDGNIYGLEIEFRIENLRKLIDSIVHRKVLDEVPYEDRREYWIHAQLKNVSVFKKLFSNVVVEDLDFFVDVGVYHEVKTSIPPVFRRELEIITKWLGTTDREEKLRLSLAHLHLKRGSPSQRKHIMELLNKLQDIFLPRKFQKFIEVHKDFRYHDCIRGVDYFSAPFPTWPKYMTVVTRTNLTLENPAADGILVFKHKDFQTEIKQILNSE